MRRERGGALATLVFEAALCRGHGPLTDLEAYEAETLLVSVGLDPRDFGLDIFDDED